VRPELAGYTRISIFISVGLFLALTACSQELTTEQQLIAVIRDMEARIEDGERRPFMNHIAESFSGQNGRMNWRQVNAMVLYQLHQNQRVRAQLLPIYVTETANGQVEARFSALLTGGPGVLPDKGQKFEFVTQWQRLDDEWKLISASWTPDVLSF
jgi:hypothetical protein